jgi:hypothetical protein
VNSTQYSEKQGTRAPYSEHEISTPTAAVTIHEYGRRKNNNALTKFTIQSKLKKITKTEY